jgi:4-amino-4-deoxy-L-arabinose transferase-like glycosyltransferase
MRYLNAILSSIGFTQNRSICTLRRNQLQYFTFWRRGAPSPESTMMFTTAAAAPIAALRRIPLSLSAAIAVLLLLHVAVWTWAGTASRSNLDLSGDMVEAFAWGQGFEWGYFKHPPLMAWVAGAWFAAMPTTHASYALLAALNTAIGLAGFALLCREFLPRRWWLLATAAAMLTPGTTTMAMRFNANAVLVAVWPWATVFFVRFMNRGRAADALACGLVCALAMLGKYFSAVLLAALLLTALAHRPWRARLASRGALLALGAFALLFAPHVAWLVDNDYGPLAYMRDATNVANDSAWQRAAHFAYCHLAFPVLGFGLIAVAVLGPGRRGLLLAALRDLVRPSSSPVWLLALLPVILTVLGTTITGARTSVVWGLPMSMGLILLFASRLAAHRITPLPRAAAAYLAVVWITVLALAPLAWWLDARRQAPTVADPRAELAQAVSAQWASRWRTPLRWVTGSSVYAEAVAFYADSHPRYWSAAEPRRQSPWANADELRAQGSAMVCDLDDRDCRELGVRLTGTEELVTVAKHDRGYDFAPRSFAVFWFAPEDSAAPVVIDVW